MASALVVFTRDLRLRDQPALAAACSRADHVVLAFIMDTAILASPFNRPNRTGFLLDSLTDLDASIRERGGHLVLRHGQWIDEVLRIAHESDATEIHIANDVSRVAQARLRALDETARRSRVDVHRHDAITIVAPGAIAPPSGDHYKVFTPYYRRWLALPRRTTAPTPARIDVLEHITGEPIPTLGQVSRGARSPDVALGGEHEAQRRLDAWLPSSLPDYEKRRDELSRDATSRLSPYLHFGCVSPVELTTRVRGEPGGEALIRQLCWRDFYHQVLAARPDASWHDYRTRDDDWSDDHDAFETWRLGRTGFPVVDAGMRQLAREGFMHNRARMITASFLTKDLYIDWRWGASHFLDWLTDGDIANNNLNWQWTAGTGTDSNPYRVFNPTVQGTRFDPGGDYVRRYVPELADIPGPQVHDADPETRRRAGYPEPIVDHRDAIAWYRARIAPAPRSS